MAAETTHKRRQAVSTVHDVVGAMRAIAAGRIQGAQHALAAARRYQDVVMRALTSLAGAATSSLLPDTQSKPPMLLVLTAEQPFCGAFNQNVLAFAERRWQELRQADQAILVVVGQRGVRQFATRGIVADAAEPAATSLPGVRDLVKRLAGRLDRRYAGGEGGPLHVIYNRYQSVSEQVPTEEIILPLDVSRLAAPAGPSSGFRRYLPAPTLLAGLVSEYAFISLYRTAADSYAGEQASRLVAMDSATRSTERMLKHLSELESRERQGQITREVLELIAARFTGE